MDTQLEQIINTLHQRTTDGKIQWKSTVTPQKFQVVVGDVTVEIAELSRRPRRDTLGSDLAVNRYLLEFISDEDFIIETIDTHRTNYVKSEVANQIGDLHVLARRQALNTQHVLNKLNKALRSL